MKKEMKDIIERNPFAKLLGIELTEIGEGCACGRMQSREQHMNIHRGMHGGCVYSLADTVAGIAAVSHHGRLVTTLDASMNYLEAVRDTEYITCKAKTVRHGNRISVIGVEIVDDRGKLLCNGSFTFYNLN